MSGRPQVLLFTIDAGGGHRAAARALEAAARERERPFRLQVESFQQVLLPLDILRRATGVSIEDGYNLILRRHWSALMVPLLRLLHGAIRVRRRSILRALVAYFRARPRPAAVVSVFPNFNGVLRDAIARSHPGVPLLVVLTDLADFPPRFWIEPGIDRVVVATEEAERQAQRIGVAPARVSRVSGMVLHPRFYACAGTAARERVRQELRIAPDAFAVMLLFGGKGSPEMHPLAARLLAADPALHLIAVCGDNPRLLDRLATLESAARGRLARLGFSERIPELLAASDLLVTKPGPGSLAEAFHMQVPVVVVRDRHTIPQERFNTDFVRDRGLGVVVRHWREIPAAVARLHRDPAGRDAIRARIAELPKNRAVDEVLDLVAREADAGMSQPSRS